jgi:hypothetical protein
VHGSRDGFGSIEELTAALKQISARTELVILRGAGHELVSARMINDATAAVVEAFRNFVAQ